MMERLRLSGKENKRNTLIDPFLQKEVGLVEDVMAIPVASIWERASRVIGQ